MFDIAAAGKAITFMSATVMQTIVGLYVLGYGSHCFLVVLEQTASGVDDVRWPDEPLVDWLWKLFYLAWLTGMWFVPAWLLIDGIGPALIESFPGLNFAQLVLACVWLLFPISLFSSLSANSRWVILRGEVLRRLAYHLVPLLVVYLVTGLLLAGWAGLTYAGLARYLWLLPLAALFGPAVLLVNARLLGRLSWLLNYRTPAKRKRRKTKRPRKSERAILAADPWAVPGTGDAAAEKTATVKPFENLYPWEFPSIGGDAEEPEVPPSLPVEGYRIRPTDWPPGPAPGTARVEKVEPLALQPLPPDPPPVTGPIPPGDPLAPLPKVSRYEEELAGHSEPPPPPRSPLWSGVYQFPWYPRCVGPWLRLSVGMLVAGAVAKVQLEFWPF
jgi:hypothetical protein